MLLKIKKTQGSEVIGIGHNEAESMDDTLSSISELAYSKRSSNDILPTQIKTRSSRSRFFFVPSESIDEEIKKRKKQFEKPVLNHVDDHIQARIKKYKKQMPKKLKHNINDVREFFLTEIAPRTVAMSAGIMQARSVVSGMLNTEVDTTVFARFEKMLNAATDMAMADFIANYFDLEPDVAKSLLSELNFKPKNMSLFPPMPREEQRELRERKSAMPVMAKPRKRRNEEIDF